MTGGAPEVSFDDCKAFLHLFDEKEGGIAVVDRPRKGKGRNGKCGGEGEKKDRLQH